MNTEQIVDRISTTGAQEFRGSDAAKVEAAVCKLRALGHSVAADTVYDHQLRIVRITACHYKTCGVCGTAGGTR